MYCRRCGILLLQGMIICPECGARQHRQASTVRCANCRGQAPMGLTVCPHCGCDLKPAGPRWGLWLAGLGVVILISLWAVGKLPVERVGQEIARVRSQVTALVQVLGPVAQGVTRPMQSLETPQVMALTTLVPTRAAPETSPEPGTAAQASSDEIIPLPGETTLTPAGTEETVTEPAATITDTLAITGTPTLDAQPAAATATLAPTSEPTSTPTLTPAPTPTPAPPTATTAPTAAAQVTPARGGQATTYRIQSGDTLSGIAQRYNISLDALLAANQLTTRSVLRIGQELVIPGLNAPIPPTATPRPNPTPTPPPTATPAPLLPAPVLKSPEDQVRFSEKEELVWEQVPGMVAGNKYRVVIRWKALGIPQEYPWFTTQTSTRVPLDLQAQADQPERRFTWFVQVVKVTTDGKGNELVIPLSPASQIYTFYWQ